MNISPADDIQDEENGVNSAVEDGLYNRVVVNIILENLSDADLRNFSLVNKFWNNEARKQMRKRSNVIANIELKNIPNSCQDVQVFGSSLERMTVVPFSGMRISVNELNHRDACTTGGLASINTKILGRISWKHLTVKLEGKSRTPKNCPAVLLVENVLRLSDVALQELTLELFLKRIRNEPVKKALESCFFSQLRTLKLEGSHEESLRYLKVLLPRAPNLQELHSRLPINVLENVLKGSSVVAYIHGSIVRAPFEEISEDFVSNLRLKMMELEKTSHSFDFWRFNRMIPMVLETCCSATLAEIRMQAIFLVPLMFYGICLRNVRTLHMSFSCAALKSYQQPVLRVLRNFDFTRVFPNLNHVDISTCCSDTIGPDHMNTIIEQASAICLENLPDRAKNMKELFLFTSRYNWNALVQMLGEMLPNVEQLYITGEPDSETLFSSVLKHWVHLKKLVIRLYKEEELFVNLDSVFCGIFPEEVDLLKEKDEEYLKNLNIVPAMPSLTCLRNLKLLQLSYRVLSLDPNADPSFTISKVIKLCAFERFPNLTVMALIGHNLFIVKNTKRHLKSGDDDATDVQAISEEQIMRWKECGFSPKNGYERTEEFQNMYVNMHRKS